MIPAAFSSTPGEFAALSLFPQARGVKGILSFNPNVTSQKEGRRKTA